MRLLRRAHYNSKHYETKLSWLLIGNLLFFSPHPVPLPPGAGTEGASLRMTERGCQNLLAGAPPVRSRLCYRWRFRTGGSASPATCRSLPPDFMGSGSFPEAPGTGLVLGAGAKGWRVEVVFLVFERIPCFCPVCLFIYPPMEAEKFVRDGRLCAASQLVLALLRETCRWVITQIAPTPSANFLWCDLDEEHEPYHRAIAAEAAA
jgi:hypothetical protein